ncbi:HEPN family nuclease [Escherichia coli]
MGNYSDFETDFVQRTLALIDQYNEMIEVLGKPFRGPELHVDPGIASWVL